MGRKRKTTAQPPAVGLLPPDAVAARLGLSRSRIYAMAAAGELPSIKFKGAVRFDPKDVEDFIREHRRIKTA